jgi:hypothetical protein
MTVVALVALTVVVVAEVVVVVVSYFNGCSADAGDQ